jgi:polyferredoxin
MTTHTCAQCLDACRHRQRKRTNLNLRQMHTMGNTLAGLHQAHLLLASKATTLIKLARVDVSVSGSWPPQHLALHRAFGGPCQRREAGF